MVSYGLKSDIRQTVLVVILVIGLIAGNILFSLSNRCISAIYSVCPIIEDFFQYWEFLGIFSTQITVVVVFGALLWLFDKYLWKYAPLNKLLGVPDLNGEWEGVLESSYKEKGEYKKVEMKLTIKQTWGKISCISTFGQSTSCCDIVCLDLEGAEGPVLKFTYTNKSHDVNLDLPRYVGYNELCLKDTNTLIGTYFTQRIPSTRGKILLVRVPLDSVIGE